MRLRLLRAFALAAVVSLVPATAFGQIVPVVTVAVAPPPLRVEVKSAPPSDRHVWIAGHWAWRGGQHEWVPGPRADFVRSMLPLDLDILATCATDLAAIPAATPKSTSATR